VTLDPPPLAQSDSVVLEKLDQARFSWFHVKAILISSVGFFTDSYDLNTVSFVNTMLGYSLYNACPLNVPPAYTGITGYTLTSSPFGNGYATLSGGTTTTGTALPATAAGNCAHSAGSLPVPWQLAVTSTATCGTLFGQLFFGAMGDRLGRKSVYGVTLGLMILATILCAATSLPYTIPKNELAVFCMWRFVLGVGIGGDYPLSATIMSEYANVKRRGAMVAVVFSAQGIGAISGAVVATVTTYVMREDIMNCVNGTLPGFNLNQYGEAVPYQCIALNTTWRIIVAIGAIPAVLTLYLRLMLPETPRYTLHVRNNQEEAEQNVEAVVGAQRFKHIKANVNADRITLFSLLSFLAANRFKFGRILIGTAVCWFLLDISFYTSLFNSTILGDIGYAPSPKSCGNNPYIAVVPGLAPGAAGAPAKYYTGQTNFTAAGGHTSYSVPTFTFAFGGVTATKQYNQALALAPLAGNPLSPLVGYSYAKPSNTATGNFTASSLTLVYACTPRTIVNGSSNYTVFVAAGYSIYDKVFKTVSGTAAILMMGYVPGYYFTIALIDWVGRLPIQYMGFTMLVFIYITISVAYDTLLQKNQNALVALFALTQFFANFGPNTTTFIIPAEAFPTKFRSTCHGFSAACGKCGALIAGLGIFDLILKKHDNEFRVAFGILAVPMFLGVFFTMLVPETKGKPLEDLGGDEVLDTAAKA
jgi:MFS family permease